MTVIWTTRAFHPDPKLNREFNRFVELTVVTGEYVIPSERIDQHLHGMIDDGSFEQLQQELGIKLIHDSSITGARLLELYAKSYAAYSDYYGEQPPAEIWADPAGCGMIIARSDEAKQPAGCGFIRAEAKPETRPAGCGVIAA